MQRTRIWLAALVTAVGVLAAGPARAGLLPVDVKVMPEGNNFRWTYSVVVPTDQYIVEGDFFTIYDFEGLIDGTVMHPDGWIFQTANLGKTPGLTTPVDDENVPNLTFIYTGEALYGQIGAGNFSASSTSDLRADGMFTSRTHRNSDNKTEDSITFTDIPRPQSGGGGGNPPPGPVDPNPPGVPEPGTVALLGLALPALGLRKYFAKKIA